MTAKLLFRPRAQAEFLEAAVWYERKRSALGTEFIAEVQKVVDAIQANPARYPQVAGDVREALAARFPYCIYYRFTAERIIVLAVFHAARDPVEWQTRS